MWAQVLGQEVPVHPVILAVPALRGHLWVQVDPVALAPRIALLTSFALQSLFTWGSRWALWASVSHVAFGSR